MTDNGQADTAVKNEQRAQTHLAVGATLVPVFFVIAFAVCIIGTYLPQAPIAVGTAVVSGPPHGSQRARQRTGLLPRVLASKLWFGQG